MIETPHAAEKKKEKYLQKSERQRKNKAVKEGYHETKTKRENNIFKKN